MTTEPENRPASMCGEPMAFEHRPAVEHFTVPWTPTEAMWSGLARDMMMWLSFPRPTPEKLFRYLENGGREIPQWLRDEPEMQALDHVPSKGTRCVLIYRAMLEACRREGLSEMTRMDEELGL